jgi:hypothetical protein
MRPNHELNQTSISPLPEFGAGGGMLSLRAAERVRGGIAPPYSLSQRSVRERAGVRACICIPKPTYFILALCRQNPPCLDALTPKNSAKPESSHSRRKLCQSVFPCYTGLHSLSVCLSSSRKGLVPYYVHPYRHCAGYRAHPACPRAPKKSQKLRQIAQGLLVSYSTIIIMLLLGEAYFRFIHAESTSFLSLSVRNWRERYEHLNSEGYRDREWQAEDFVGRTVVFAIGDSFTQAWYQQFRRPLVKRSGFAAGRRLCGGQSWHFGQCHSPAAGSRPEFQLSLARCHHLAIFSERY